MKPLAIVISWFGRDLKGGAETQAWQIASRLAARGHAIEVLTTCCRSHFDDCATNHLPPGLTREPEGFAVRRFPVTRRKRKQFDRVSSRLQRLPKTALKPGVAPVSAADSKIFSHELIKSPALLRYLKEHGDDYSAFVFMPYLYGPVLHGLPLVADRAWLQPCLHDESYAYLPEVAAIFRCAHGVLFNSDGEMELALRLFGPGIFHKSTVVGEGVEVPVVEPGTVASATAVFDGAPYVLCLGKKERGKNSHLLLNAFRQFKAAHPTSRLKLVFAGAGVLDLGGLDGQVLDLGMVSERDKVTLLDGCRALFQPSENESFSRVIMEAWLRGRPVAAHRDCLATATAVRLCDGGWLAADEKEWSTLLGDMESLPTEVLAAKGAAGQQYARKAADWQRVMERYEAVLSVTTPRVILVPRTPRAIHQVLPNFTYGDGISNFVRWTRKQLLQAGISSEIFVLHIDPRVANECHRFQPGCIASQDAIIYHHSIGSELTTHVATHEGPKCLLYHNITPAEFFEPFHPKVTALLRQGREELKWLSRSFPCAVGQSAYNAQELQEAGFVNPLVCPACVDPARWSEAPDSGLMARLQQGHTNVLFVGRISPQKKQEDLLRAFQVYLQFDPTAVLHLVGTIPEGDPYAAYVRRAAELFELGEHVQFAGAVDENQLAAYYRTAHLFWSMSEHEGFCVPLVESMWHDVPVLAYNSTAVGETLGAGGVLFNRKNRLKELAALAWLLVNDNGLRQQVIAAQRRRRTFCAPAAVAEALQTLVNRLC
ncbi:MAG: glycosyltransferase [Verrucomicrobiia bacterium]